MREAMVATVFHGAGDVRVESVPVPIPREGEVLIEVVAAGICGTDAHEFASGPHMFPGASPHPRSGHAGPMVMGHEFAGRVVEMGAGVAGLGMGELVVSSTGVACGKCVHCGRGRPNLCEMYWTVGLQANGGLAEYVVVPASTCFSVEPYGLSEDLAGLAQPMAIAVHAVRRGRVQEGDEVVVLGAGGIGAFLVRALADVTDRISVIDFDPNRLEIALLNGASNTAVLTDGFDIETTRLEWGIRPTVIFEVSGTRAGFEAAQQWLEPGGRLVLVGIQAGQAELDLRSLSLVEHEVLGTNAHVATEDFPRALELLRNGGAWSVIAPEVLPLTDVVSEGLTPMVERRSTRIKTLFDPRLAEARASNMRLLQ